MKIHLLIGLAAFALWSCSQPKETSSSMPPLPADPHSFAQPDRVKVKHTHLDLKVDFQTRTIQGTARLDITAAENGDTLVLDTRNLNIQKVRTGNPAKELAFSLDSAQPFLGQALRIPVPKGASSQVFIDYSTTEGADALQWLEPEQTAGKKHPFLFTQGQAILSRTWFPCQDGPGIRFTWSADVQVPAGLKAVMSSENRTADTAAGKFHFEMPHPVPAYLVALSVGNLAFQPIDARTGVFAEPEMLSKSVYEFADLGKMVEAAESLYGTYRWGRYNVLVLPPSFPFGGMENPCVTFATPTILAGDRSLVSLIAHELAHSWSGNLVTNSNWNDFWLNEGFTVYFERRIMEKLEGKEYADMLAVIGYQDLTLTLEDLKNEPQSTCLKLNLAGKDPDDGMNDIAYEKGYRLLCLIEKQVGREKWDAFLKGYFDAHAFQSMTTEDFLSYLEAQLLKPAGISLETSGIKDWIYKPGLPAGAEVPVSARFEAVEKALTAFSSGTLPQKETTTKWSSHEWLHFLRGLPDGLSSAQMKILDESFHFTQTGNNELLFEWLMWSVKVGYAPADAALENFLIHTGRRKFVLPLYKELVKTEAGKQRAARIFELGKANYHSVTRGSVAALFASK